MKKVLYVLHDSSYKGANRSFIDYLTTDVKKDATVVFPISDDNELENILKENNIPFARFKIHADYYRKFSIKLWIKQKFAYERFLQSEIKQIDELVGHQFDIVHTNSLTTIVGALFADQYNIPHVWHAREFLKEDFGMTYFNPKLVFFNLMPESNMIFITKAIQEKFGKYCEKNQAVIFNGISNKALPKLPHSGTNLMIAGSLTAGKGQTEAIYAANELIKEHYDIKLHIFGEGEDEAKLKKLVKELGIDNKVIFYGFTNNLFEHRRSMDIALICSKKEALGRVTIESMYAENFVIGANTGGTKELIGENNLHGLLYHQGDYKDLASKIRLVLEKRIETKPIIEAAKLFAFTKCSPEACYREIDKFYDKALKKKQ
jgi:glycosyltransferase involved in cell wall biosynthesis